MAQIAFDTLGYVKTLTEGGFSQEQAEALAKAQHVAFMQMADTKELPTQVDLRKLATKLDLLELETRMINTLYGALTRLAFLIAAIIGLAAVLTIAILK